MPEFVATTKECPISPEESVLLPDGGILYTTNGAPILGTVYRPDDMGDYSNGSFSPVISLNIQQVGSCMSVGQNGRIYRYGGHAGQGGESTLLEYNPTTHAFRNTGITSYGHFSTGVLERNDGRLGRLRLNQWHSIDTSSGEPVLNVVNLTGGAVSEEYGFAKIPDGSFVGFVNEVYGAGTLRVEKVNAAITTFSVPTITKPSSYSPTAWRYLAPQVLEFTDGVSGPREICSPIWMPKIGKVVMQGAKGGEIFVFDPVTNELTIPAHLTRRSDLMTATQFGNTLWTCASGITLNTGLVGTLDITATSGSFMSGGVLSFSKMRLFTSNDGQWVFVTFSSSSRISGGSTSAGEAGDVFRLTNVTVVQGSGTTTGKADSVNNPVLGSYESWSSITPSGDYLAQSGWGNFLTVWDGVSSTATDPWMSTWPASGRHDLITWSPNLHTWVPTGQMITLYSRKVHIWTPVATPREDQKPVITSFPSRVLAGEVVTVGGNQLWGRHVGITHNDDYSMRCNMPVFSLHAEDGRVFFCPSKNWSTRSIEPNIASTAAVTIPLGIPDGNYVLRCASAGNISADYSVKVGQSIGGGVVINQYA